MGAASCSTNIMSTIGTTSGSSLASVVFNPERLEKWGRLGDSEPLAELHAKFWGKSMAEEENAWRVKQQSTSDPGEGEDDNTDEGEDDDITSGCYVLDIDNDGVNIQSIWVRVSVFQPGEALSSRTR